MILIIWYSYENIYFLQINENVLLKELQCKKVDKLKISNSTKEKVAEYIKKYMSRFGEVYKRKTIGMYDIFNFFLSRKRYKSW